MGVRTYLSLLRSIARCIGKGNFSNIRLQLALKGPDWYKTKVWNKYCTGFCSKAEYEISNPRVREFYKNFTESGYVVISEGGRKVLSALEGIEYGVRDGFGRQKRILSSEETRDAFDSLDHMVPALLAEIYGRKYWIRDPAFVIKHNSTESEYHIQSSWHIDGYNQVTAQVLLKDTDENNVCTEFIIGSQNKTWSFDRRLIESAPVGQRFAFTGKAGDLILFNGGQCLHRSKLGLEGREALFINFSSGWYEGSLSER